MVKEVIMDLHLWTITFYPKKTQSCFVKCVPLIPVIRASKHERWNKKTKLY